MGRRNQFDSFSVLYYNARSTGAIGHPNFFVRRLNGRVSFRIRNDSPGNYLVIGGMFS